MHEIQKLKEAQKQKISQDKVFTKCWAENRRLCANPASVAQEVVVHYVTSQAIQRINPHTTMNLQTIAITQVVTQLETKPDVIIILFELNEKQMKLARRIEEIDLAIQVIKNI